MSTIVASPTGLAVLNRQQTGPLSSLPVRLSSQTLKSASRGDIAKLSASAVQYQQTQQLLGQQPASSPASASEALLSAYKSSINLLG